MGAVTYPDPDVAELLNTQFACYKLNMKEPLDSDAIQLLRTLRVLWTPDLMFCDARGIQVRRQTGYVPPDDFLGDLQLVLGLVAMIAREFHRAVEHFESAAGPDRSRSVAAEALYWKGIAAYRTRNDRAVLRHHWDEIRERFGTTAWWTRAEASYGKP